MPSISVCVQSYRNSRRAAGATSPTGTTVLVLMDPRPIINFLLNNFPACYQRSARSTATLGCARWKPHLQSTPLRRAPYPTLVIPTGVARPSLARGVCVPGYVVEESLFDCRAIADLGRGCFLKPYIPRPPPP